MLQADTPPPVVTAVLGHAVARTTAAHYLRLDTEHLRRCALETVRGCTDHQPARSGSAGHWAGGLLERVRCLVRQQAQPSG